MDLKPSPFAPTEFPALPTIEGVRAATMAISAYQDLTLRMKVLFVDFPDGAAAGGVFTKSSTRSADVDWCREALATGGGRASALVVNSGNSNAFTGAAGIAKNEATLASVGELLGYQKESIFLSATGVIGEPLPARVLADKLPAIAPDLGPVSWPKAAQAIMTTDTFPKGSGAETEIAGTPVKIAGIAKGSGMIAPNMATMLSYIFTDAAISPAVCQALISRHADTTFNCVTVDSDTSTSDTLILFATGKAGNGEITEPDDPRLEAFSSALHDVLKDLAHQLVKDGEGASKFIEIKVTGAESDHAAKVIACSIANSPLVKTALAASDANWGRVVMAVGKTDEAVNRDKLSISFGEVEVARNGQRVDDYSEEAASAVVAQPEITLTVDVGVGGGSASVWTCDLTHGYVEINGAYRT